jgi:hypothetical protein
MPSKMKRPYTLAEVERIRDMAACGLSVTQIADTPHRSWESVRALMLRQGIVIPKPRIEDNSRQVPTTK